MHLFIETVTHVHTPYNYKHTLLGSGTPLQARVGGSNGSLQCKETSQDTSKCSSLATKPHNSFLTSSHTPYPQTMYEWQIYVFIW